jgi:RNA polymerase sigma-70 factor (ECF subfamily)
VQGGDREAYGTIYTRYFGRVYGYLRLVLKDHHDAEDTTQEVFARALKALPRYEHRGRPFRAWLFTVVRNAAIDRMMERDQVTPMEEEEVARIRQGTGEVAELPDLDWITDPDLALLIERLTLLQRQVLLLRYMFDLDYRQIGAILGKSEDSVRAQNYQALEFLRERLARLGRSGLTSPKGAPIRRTTRKANVLRSRRYALDP